MRFVSVDVAIAAIADVVRSLPSLNSIQAPVSFSLLNSYLSEAVISPCNIPSGSTSTMDGYALHLDATSEPIIFRKVASIHAGPGPSSLSLEAGQAAYVTTGSLVPEGTDAVIPIEWTTLTSDDIVKVNRPIRSGSFIRQIGQDVKTGQEVLALGKKIEAIDLALLISLGIDSVSVYRHVRVGVCSSGDELIDIHETLTGVGQVRDSNRFMIIAYLRELKEPLDIVDMGIVRDQIEGASDSISEKIRNVLPDLDVLISTGGVSMGSHDLLKEFLEVNAKIHFHGICMKPGKPTIFAQIGQCLILALPGNPLSAACNFYLFVKPALRLMASQKPDRTALHNNVQCRINGSYPCNPDRPVYQFAWVYWDPEQSGLVAIPTIQSSDCSNSSRLLTAQHANGIIHSPVQHEAIQNGQMLTVTLIRPLDSFEVSHDACSQSQHIEYHDTQMAPTTDHFRKDGARAIKACLLVCSDRAFHGEYQDKSGPAATQYLVDRKIQVMEVIVVPDEWNMIRNQIISWTDDDRCECDVVFTIGGTGLSSRDITPDVTATLLDRSLPSFAWAMISDGRLHTPNALLSRAQAGIRRRTMIINLAGSVKGCVQNLSTIVPVLRHAVALVCQDG